MDKIDVWVFKVFENDFIVHIKSQTFACSFVRLFETWYVSYYGLETGDLSKT